MATAEPDLLRVLRTLTQAAARFDKVAAHHKRFEAERKGLQDALTEAQLVLSVNDSWKVKEDDDTAEDAAAGRKSPRPAGGKRKPKA
jgi:hypothetical protein